MKITAHLNVIAQNVKDEDLEFILLEKTLPEKGIVLLEAKKR